MKEKKSFYTLFTFNIIQAVWIILLLLQLVFINYLPNPKSIYITFALGFILTVFLQFYYLKVLSNYLKDNDNFNDSDKFYWKLFFFFGGPIAIVIFCYKYIYPILSRNFLKLIILLVTVLLIVFSSYIISYNILIKKANLLIEKKNYHEVVNLIESSINFYKSPMMYLLLGETFLRLEENEKAIITFKVGLENNPKNIALMHDLAYSYYSINEYNMAIDEVNKIMTIDPNNIHAHYVLGLCYYLLEEFDSSLDVFDKLLLLEPDYDEAYYFKAKIIRKTDMMKAIELYKVSAKLGNKKSQNILQNKGIEWNE